jgi:hypothetical protein
VRIIERAGLGAFQLPAAEVVQDVVVPPLLPTRERLSERYCAMRKFHPRKVRYTDRLLLSPIPAPVPKCSVWAP